MLRIYEPDILRAIENYIIYGLHPGSYALRLLMQDTDSIDFAHYIIKKGDYDYHQNHVEFVESMPEEFKGPDMENWPGIIHLSQSQQFQLFFSLKLKEDRYSQKLFEKYQEDIENSIDK